MSTIELLKSKVAERAAKERIEESRHDVAAYKKLLKGMLVTPNKFDLDGAIVLFDRLEINDEKLAADLEVFSNRLDAAEKLKAADPAVTAKLYAEYQAVRAEAEESEKAFKAKVRDAFNKHQESVQHERIAAESKLFLERTCLDKSLNERAENLRKQIDRLCESNRVNVKALGDARATLGAFQADHERHVGIGSVHPETIKNGERSIEHLKTVVADCEKTVHGLSFEINDLNLELDNILAEMLVP